jgi:hypothetical protein
MSSHNPVMICLPTSGLKIPTLLPCSDTMNKIGAQITP